jgi:hypothetical protein
MMETMKKEHMRRLLDPSMAAIAIILLMLLPFAILSYYSHPQADDFSAAATTLRLGYFKAVASVYNVWNGRWFSTALMQANPMAFGSISACKLIPVLILLFWSLFILIKAVLPQINRSRERFLCALALLALYLSSMPSVAQGFYWMSSAINYQLANAMMLLLWAQMAKLAGAPASKAGRGTLAAAIMLVFAITGSNETHMAVTLFMFAAALVWRSVKTGRIDRLFAGFLVLAVIAAAIVVIAPGNSARMAHDSRTAINLSGTFRQSALVMAQLARDQVTKPLFLVLTLCAIPFFASKLQNSGAPGSTLNPGALSVVWICSMLATIVPVVRVVGWAPERVLNVTSLIFIMGWFLIVNEIVRRIFLKGSYRLWLASAPRYVVAIVIALACFALAGSTNIRAAWGNLLDGTASRYDRELRRRYEEIKSCRDETCVVAPLTAFPSLLYYEDINTEADSWLNRPYAEYFGKHAITLAGPEK